MHYDNFCNEVLSNTEESRIRTGLYSGTGHSFLVLLGKQGMTNSGDTNSEDTNSGDINSGDTNSGDTNSGDTK